MEGVPIIRIALKGARLDNFDDSGIAKVTCVFISHYPSLNYQDLANF